jgi:hypothetical protein
VAVRGFRDPEFFNRLHAAGIHLRMQDDPMLVVSRVLGYAGAAVLCVDDGAVLSDELAAELRENETFLKLVVLGHGLAGLCRSRQVNDVDAVMLGRFLAFPEGREVLDFLLRPEADR